MKRTIFYSGTMAIICVLLFQACSKNNTASPTPGNDAALKASIIQNAADQTGIQDDDDFIESDVTNATNAANNFNGTIPDTIENFTVLGGSLIDMSSLSSNKTIKIIYNPSNPISGITKSGTVTIQLIKGTKWSDVDAELLETLDSVKVTYAGSAKTRTYQAMRYVTNISGGTKFTISAFDPFIYTLHSYGTVTFEDNSFSSYWITRKNSFYASPLTFTSSGDTTIAGNQCSMGGVSRYQTNFVVQAPQVYVAAITCGFNKPFSGIRIYTTESRNDTLTFGLEQNGTQATSTTACDSVYGYQIAWLKYSGVADSVLIPY